MGERLTEEDKIKLRERTVISKDDLTAHCNQSHQGGPRVREVEPDVPNGKHWVVTNLDGRMQNVEADRFFDVRAFGVLLFGGCDVGVSGPFAMGDTFSVEIDGGRSEIKVERGLQLKWSGSALDPRNQPHMIFRDQRTDQKWRPVREIEPNRIPGMKSPKAP